MGVHMWYRLLRATREPSPFTDAVAAVLQVTPRLLIVAVVGIYGIFYLASPFVRSDRLEPLTFLVSPILVVSSILAWRLVQDRFLLAQVVWQVGLVATAVLCAVVLQEPFIALLLALLPLVTTLTIGWPGALIAEALVVALAAWLAGSPLVPAFSGLHGLAVAVGGLLSGVLGEIAIAGLLRVSETALVGAEHAQQGLREWQSDRLELGQVREDLMLANREMARLSDRLRAMLYEAEAARRAKEEFVANVSHELRTPLNMIIGFSEMILQSSVAYGIELPPTVMADIAAIERNGQHLAGLVDDILDLSRVEAGRMALSREWVSLDELVSSAVLTVRPLFSTKGLYLDTVLPPDLPEVFCDRTRIRQVLVNLLSNAGRFTESGGVRVEAEHREGEVRVEVSDTGPGIAAEDQQKLFVPFQQVDGSVRRRHGGTGLGLSISRQFVEMHGGKIELQSELAVGTTIAFTLPVEPPEMASLDQRDSARRWFSPYHHFEPRSRPSAAPTPDAPPRLVLFESGESMRNLLLRYLPGYEVISFDRLDEAIEDVGRSPARALLINDPVALDGPPYPEKVGDLPFRTPVLAFCVAGRDAPALQLGAAKYMVKPITRQMLLAELENLGDSVSKVLLVDDDPEALQLFSRMLSAPPHRYQVLRADSGPEALRLLREQKPDAMLLDLVMPGMDGFRVLTEKRGDPSIRDVSVIIATSMDATGQPVVTETLSVSRSGGLSASDLLTCIEALSEILSPRDQKVDPAPAR